MKTLILLCLVAVVCGCGNDLVMPGGSAESDGDTTTITNSYNPVDNTINNGVDICKVHCEPVVEDGALIGWDVTQECQNTGRQGPDFFAEQPSVCYEVTPAEEEESEEETT